MEPETILGDYKVLELIGKGGQGRVYKALDLNLKRVVALKIFFARDEFRRQKLASFKYEARLASALNHPNICTVYGLFDDEDHTYMVMEYVAGKNLYEVAYHRPLEIESAVGITIQITEALIVAHKQGIIHRDIKPRNVVVEPSGRAVVLDFGLAKLLENPDGSFDDPDSFVEDDNRLGKGFFSDIAEDLYVTVEGTSQGTPASSAPEMALGKPTDHRADVFSTGVLLYLLLSGEYPFFAATKTEVRNKVISEDPVPVSVDRRAGSPVPLSLIAIVQKALRKKAEERFQTMEEMRDRLIAVLKEIERNEDYGKSRSFPVFGPGNTLYYEFQDKKRIWLKPLIIVAILVVVFFTLLFCYRLFQAN